MKNVGYSEYSVEEIDKRGAVPLLMKILNEERGHPLVKEIAVATLASILFNNFYHHNTLIIVHCYLFNVYCLMFNV